MLPDNHIAKNLTINTMARISLICLGLSFRINEILFLHSNQSHLFIGNGKKNLDLKILIYFDHINSQKLGIPAIV